MKTYELTVTTSSASASVQGDSTPQASADNRQRVTWSCNEFGRGVSVTIKPLDADTQFVIHSVRVYVIPSNAGPDDA